MSENLITKHGIISPYLTFWAYFPEYFENLYYKKPIDLLDGSYNAIIDYVKKIPGSPTILDIGANSGLVSVPLGMLGYDVISVEPVPINIECLKRAIIENELKTVNIVPYAVALESGTRKLYVPQAQDNSSFDARTAVANMPDKNRISTIDVLCVTLDELVSTHDLIDKTVFIKIDVQGYEHEVLFSGQTFLEKTKSCHILFEADDTLPQQVPLADVVAFLAGKGFVQAAGVWNKDLLFIKTSGQ